MAREILIRPLGRFRVSVPKLRWSAYYRGFYNPKTQTIWMGRKLRSFNNPDTLLHEFAHHLNVMRGGVPYYHHRFPFVVCLIEVASVQYGNAARYNWDAEYSTVERLARPLLNQRFNLDLTCFDKDTP